MTIMKQPIDLAFLRVPDTGGKMDVYEAMIDDAQYEAFEKFIAGIRKDIVGTTFIPIKTAAKVGGNTAFSCLTTSNHASPATVTVYVNKPFSRVNVNDDRYYRMVVNVTYLRESDEAEPIVTKIGVYPVKGTLAELQAADAAKAVRNNALACIAPKTNAKAKAKRPSARKSRAVAKPKPKKVAPEVRMEAGKTVPLEVSQDYGNGREVAEVDAEAEAEAEAEMISAKEYEVSEDFEEEVEVEDAQVL